MEGARLINARSQVRHRAEAQLAQLPRRRFLPARKPGDSGWFCWTGANVAARKTQLAGSASLAGELRSREANICYYLTKTNDHLSSWD